MPTNFASQQQQESEHDEGGAPSPQAAPTLHVEHATGVPRSLGVQITTGTGTESVSTGDPSPRGVAEVHEKMSSNDRKDDDAKDRRPSVQEAYASKLHAAKVHIAANAAFEAIQRVEAERAATAAAAAAPSAKKTGGYGDAKDEKHYDMMEIEDEMSSAKFFRGSISEHSNSNNEKQLGIPTIARNLAEL